MRFDVFWKHFIGMPEDFVVSASICFGFDNGYDRSLINYGCYSLSLFRILF